MLTLEPGGAGYSTVPITNVWGISPDFWLRTSSLNNRQALPNADGSFTVVVSSWDLSVANWVDTAGMQEGILMLRWQLLPQAPEPDHEPAVRSVLVKRNELDKALPAGTASFTKARREVQLGLRRSAFARRLQDRN